MATLSDWIFSLFVIPVLALVITIALRVRRDAKHFEEQRQQVPPPQASEEEAEEDLPPPPEFVPVTGYLGDQRAAEVVARLTAAGIPAVAVFHSESDFVTGKHGATDIGNLVMVPPDRQPEAVHLIDPHPDEGTASMTEIQEGFREEDLPPDHPDARL